MEQKYSYLNILNEHLENRCTKNSNYSLRAFARDLQLSPSRLSEILSRKKGLSTEAARDIAHKLGLSPTETDLFVLSVESQHARSPKAKEKALSDLENRSANHADINFIGEKEFTLAQNWYHMALLELMDLRECKHTIDWFAKKLSLNKVMVKNALERMEALGWIVFQNGKYKSRFEKSETSFDIPSAAIKSFHQEILKKAEVSLYTDSVKEREFLNMTLAFSTEQVKEAKEEIRRFQKTFAEKFHSKSKNKNSVYQLSIQFFRVDTKFDA